MSEKEIKEEELINEAESELVEDEQELVEVELSEVEKIEKLEAEIAELKDKYARVHADFDNIKKRLEREKYNALDYAQEKFAKDLIPVVDSLGLALSSSQGDLSAEELLVKVREGVELTMKQFLSALEKHGITPVSEEEPFDPNIHHAVQQIDSGDHESGEIVSTFQKGYKYKDRTLRDAMVIIAN